MGRDGRGLPLVTDAPDEPSCGVVTRRMGCGPETRIAVMAERDAKIRDALNPLFWWAREPAVLSAAVISMVIATVDYFEAIGSLSMDNATLGFVLTMVASMGIIIRSQVSPVSKL